MGKTPRSASAGILVALLLSAGCASTPPVGTPVQSGTQPYRTNPSANGATGTNGNMSATGQGAMGSGLANGQIVGNSANTRPMSQGYAGSGNFQNNFTNTSVPSGGYNQNSSSNNIQPASYNQNQSGAGIQQTGSWPPNQSSAAGSAPARTMSRNTDDSSSGNGISAAMPPPSWPTNNTAGSSYSKDPPPVTQPTSLNYSTKYQPLPFNSSGSGN